MRNWTFAALAALMLSGCANNYQKFYKAEPPDWKLVRSMEEPVLAQSSGTAQVDIQRMFTDGYGVIGSSAFVAPLADRAGAIAQAKKVGANRVLLASQYRSTRSGAMPITTPTSSTAYTSGNVYGSYGSSARYSGTTTTYGSETTYVPYSVDHYVQYALYFGPLQRKGLGVMLDRPTDEAKRAAGTNKGHQVSAVRRGSPAFQADILPGDLIVTIGRDMVEPDDFTAAVISNQGSKTEFVLYRASTQITKTLVMPMPDETW